MKIGTKLYLYQIFFSLVVFAFLFYLYKSYEKQYISDIDRYVESVTTQEEKNTLLRLELIDYILNTKEQLFYSINLEAKKRLLNNPDISLMRLKKELIQKFKLKDTKIELYMVNKDYIIYDTTFAKDLGFDLSTVYDSEIYINKCNEDNGIHFTKTIALDSMDKKYKKYTFTKIKKDTYLEMGFIDESMHDFISKNIQRSGFTNIYRVITFHDTQYFININTKNKLDSKQNFFANMKKFKLNELTDNSIINATRIDKIIKVQNKNTLSIYKLLLSYKNIPSLRDADIVMQVDVDISDKLETLDKFKNVFLYISILIFFFLLFIFFWLKRNFAKPIETIATSISNSDEVKDTSLLNNESEFGVIAKEYNSLFKSLNKEVLYNKVLLDENRRFIADTVHQIRTPLSIIMMNSDLIKMIQKDEAASEFIDQINASINMLSNSYEDLAYIISHETIEYKASNISMSNILKERVSFFSTISKVNEKEIVSLIEDNITTEINQIEFERLIDNNLSNAIKYADLNKPITVKLFKNDKEIQLLFFSHAKEIKDKTRLFEKNYRENEEKRGLGLGLNIVKTVCDKYNINYDVKYQKNQNIFQYIFKI